MNTKKKEKQRGKGFYIHTKPTRKALCGVAGSFSCHVFCTYAHCSSLFFLPTHKAIQKKNSRATANAQKQKNMPGKNCQKLNNISGSYMLFCQHTKKP